MQIVEYAIFRWKLWRLRAADRRIVKGYREERKAPKGENTRTVHDMDEAEHFERTLKYDEISQLKSRHLCRIAARNDIHISQDDEWWETSFLIGGRFLSSRGYSELRAAIRKEKSERRDQWYFWPKVLGAVVAVGVALIGVLRAFGLL